MPARRRSSSRKRVYKRRRSYSSYGRRTYRRSTPRVRQMSRSARGRTQCVCPGDMSPGTKFALAQLDPFDVVVSGAKVPDSNVQPSISTTDIEQVSLTSSAVSTDLNGMAFRPQYTWGTVTATAGAALGWGATYTSNSNYRSKRTAYANAIELTRPVAHGIRISSPIAPTNASGFVHVALSTETNYGTAAWTFPTTIAQISGCQFYKRVTLASLTQSPLTICNKWTDETAFRYSSPTSDIIQATGIGFQTDFSWAVIVIITEGVPVSANVISAEHCLISEGIPQKDGPILGTPAAASSPGTLSATSNMMSNTEPTHTEAENQSYVARGAQAIVRGAQEQGEAVFQQVGAPILQHLGRAGVNAGAQYFYNMVTGVGGIGGVNSNPNRLTN